jgi:cell shape-determining protein MreC
MSGNTSIGEDPITIFTLLSELQREAEVWKRDCKKWEERVSSREALVRQEQTRNEGLAQQIEELQI